MNKSNDNIKSVSKSSRNRRSDESTSNDTLAVNAASSNINVKISRNSRSRRVSSSSNYSIGSNINRVSTNGSNDNGSRSSNSIRSINDLKSYGDGTYETKNRDIRVTIPENHRPLGNPYYD